MNARGEEVGAIGKEGLVVADVFSQELHTFGWEVDIGWPRIDKL